MLVWLQARLHYQHPKRFRGLAFGRASLFTICTHVDHQPRETRQQFYEEVPWVPLRAPTPPCFCLVTIAPLRI